MAIRSGTDIHKLICIYCGRTFDGANSEGDHIIPARLGEFRNSPKFKNICQFCNNKIGKSEEQLLRCGPERLYRDLVVPETNRSRGKKSSWAVGSSGAPPPKILIKTPNGELMGRPGPDPLSPEIIDQIVIEDNSGGEFPIPLFPKMTTKNLKKQISELIKTQNIKGNISIRWNCNEEYEDHYKKLIKELYPNAEMKPLPPLEPGRYSVPGRMEFKVSDHYFRALAKISFHYYLATSQRVTGQESGFSSIRSFICNGGKYEDFFEKKKRIVLPIPQGMAPSRWCHVLAVHESNKGVTGYIALFLGPTGRKIENHIRLGQLDSHLLLPDFVWSHVFTYDENPTSIGKVGDAFPAALTKIWP